MSIEEIKIVMMPSLRQRAISPRDAAAFEERDDRYSRHAVLPADHANDSLALYAAIMASSLADNGDFQFMAFQCRKSIVIRHVRHGRVPFL